MEARRATSRQAVEAEWVCSRLIVAGPAGPRQVTVSERRNHENSRAGQFHPNGLSGRWPTVLQIQRSQIRCGAAWLRTLASLSDSGQFLLRSSYGMSSVF